MYVECIAIPLPRVSTTPSADIFRSAPPSLAILSGNLSEQKISLLGNSLRFAPSSSVIPLCPLPQSEDIANLLLPECISCQLVHKVTT